jgi:hypothetical protein
LVNDDDSGHDSEVESTVMAASSSPTHGVTKMADGKTPELTDFFKKMTLTKDDRRAYHERGWLTRNLVSFIPEAEAPTVEGSTILCFESQLTAGLRLKNVESRLKAAEEDLKNHRQLLESARKTLSKCEGSFNMMIFSTVAHVTALFKNHLSDLNMKLLHQDFTIDDAERETLVSSAFDATQDFVSSYNFASLAESDDNDSPRLCKFFLLHVG